MEMASLGRSLRVGGLTTQDGHRTPLLLEDRRLGLIWSEKAACTTALIWYLWQTGRLQAANELHRWPHKFRQALFATDEYRALVQRVRPQQWTWVRVIRDPYRRAVSSYRHALKHTYADAEMRAVLGESIDYRQVGFSFERFLDYLSAIDVTACNPHHRAQHHPLEDVVAPAIVINADRCDLLAELRAMGQRLGFVEPPAEPLGAKIAEIARRHHAKLVKTGMDQAEVTLTPANARGAWPIYDEFLRPSTRARIARIYARDVEAYAPWL